MLKSISHAIKRLLLAAAGALGGVVVGGILSLLLFHLKVAHSIEIRSLGLTAFLTLIASSIAGMLAPRFFMMFFLSPLSWFMDADASGGGHPSGDFDVTWPNFLLNVAYLVGLPLYAFGAVFSLPWVVGAGLTGILAFAIGVYPLSRGTKGKPAASEPPRHAPRFQMILIPSQRSRQAPSRRAATEPVGPRIP
jgi:hypothetical protein